MPSKVQEFRRAWPVLAASTTGAGVGVAVLAFYSFSAFVGPLSAAFGWSRTAITAAPLVFTLGSLAAGPPVGMLADRIGARPVALASQVLLALALVGLALLTRSQVWTLYTGYLALALLGAGTTPIIWSRAITGWFKASRGMALGVSLMGTGICGALLPLYVSTLCAHVGWRGAYLGLAALPVVLGLPVALLGFREAPEAGPTPGLILSPEPASDDYDLRQAAATPEFWRLSVSLFLAASALGSLMVHGLPLLTSRGFKGAAAAGVVGLLGVFATIGRLISGYFLDLQPATRVACVTFAIPAVACAILLGASHSLAACALALSLAGLAAGAELDISGYIVARYFGHRHYGAIFGLIYTLYGVGSGLGPALVGMSFDATRSYDAALAVGVGVFAVAALLALTLRPPGVRPLRATAAATMRA